MDRRLAVIRVGLAGGAFVLGLYLGEAAISAPTPVPAVQANETGWLSEPTRKQLGGGSHRDRRAWFLDLTRQEQALRSQLDAVTGGPTPWPEGPPLEMTEAFFRETLLPAYLERAGRTPALVDCGSYPCVAVFADPLPPEEEDKFFDAVLARNDLFRDWGKERVVWLSERGVNYGSDGVQWVLTVWALLPPEPTEEQRQRIKARLRLEMIEQRRVQSLLPAQP